MSLNGARWERMDVVINEIRLYYSKSSCSNPLGRVVSWSMYVAAITSGRGSISVWERRHRQKVGVRQLKSRQKAAALSVTASDDERGCLWATAVPDK